MKRGQTIIVLCGIMTVISLSNCDNTLFSEKKNNLNSINIFESSSKFSRGSESVKIGNQQWATKNLEVSAFRNGDLIQEAKTNDEWVQAGEYGKPAWCYYNNDSVNGRKYGKLYNWYAVNDTRGLAPLGWHIPSDVEWIQLIDYLEGEAIAGTRMKSKEGWIENGNGTNESGFYGLPGGYRIYDGNFEYVDYAGYWWSSTDYVKFLAWNSRLFYRNGIIIRDLFGKDYGFSVRCISNNDTL